MILPDDEVSTIIGTLYSIELRHHRESQRRAPGAYQNRNLVLLDELFDGADRFGRVGLVVLDDQLDFLAEHAAGLH